MSSVYITLDKYTPRHGVAAFRASKQTNNIHNTSTKMFQNEINVRVCSDRGSYNMERVKKTSN